MKEHFAAFGVNAHRASTKNRQPIRPALMNACRYLIHPAARIARLLVEQNVRAAVEVADTACVLDDGRVAFAGRASEFASDEASVRSLAGASVENWGARDTERGNRG